MGNEAHASGAPIRNRVLIVDDDLFFSVRIQSGLSKLGYVAKIVSPGDAEMEARKEQTALAVINFGSQRMDASEIAKQIKALPNAPAVLGFVPHKQLPFVRENAKLAGVDLLVANSALTLRLPYLAAKLAPLDGSDASVSEAAAIVAEDEEED
jgi:CheY-like chemotaxis protein